MKVLQERSNDLHVTMGGSWWKHPPAFVVSKSALTHRNCLCVYHENVRLLLKDVDKYVDGTECSCLSTFTDSS
ncbi:unnamed protein product, partial [Rotaria magnacalcarata]